MSGSSTTLNSIVSNKSLFTNSKWNPYIANTDSGQLDPGNLWNAGIDGSFRNKQFFADAELHMGRFKNASGSITLSALSIQAGKSITNYENYHGYDFAVRYSALRPDTNFAYKTATTSYTLVENKKLFHEITPSATMRINSSTKIMLDLPYMIGIPTVDEVNIGSFVMTEHPDQVSALAKTGSTIGRKNTMQARLMLQMMF